MFSPEQILKYAEHVFPGHRFTDGPGFQTTQLQRRRLDHDTDHTNKGGGVKGSTSIEGWADWIARPIHCEDGSGPSSPHDFRDVGQSENSCIKLV